MNILAELRDVDFGFVNLSVSEYRKRVAARAVLLKDNNVALMHVSKKGYYKLPGGGVDEGESVEQGLRRELLEETGCECEILKPVGVIKEFRDRTPLEHQSNCFLAKTSNVKCDPFFTEKERSEGMTLMWVPLTEAVNLIKNSTPSSYSGKFIVKRDLIFVEKAKEILNANNL